MTQANKAIAATPQQPRIAFATRASAGGSSFIAVPSIGHSVRVRSRNVSHDGVWVWSVPHMLATYMADQAHAEQYGRRLAQRFARLRVTIDDQPIGSTRSC